MSLLQSSLLLLSLLVLSSWRVSSGTFIVTQSPDVSVMEGETFSITCCWPGKFERIGVNWLKNQTVIKAETNFNQSQGSLKKEEKKCSSLNFSKIQIEDSGTYMCKVTVEIPSLFEAKGNGTVITVKKMGRNGTFVTVKAEIKKDKGNGTVITIMPEVKKDDNTDQHIARRVSSGILVVTQSPDFSVMEGETVSITCCWPGKFERIGVQWLKNQTVIKTETNFNQSKGSLKKEEKKCSSLNISNIRTEDSGTYICKVTVEIPSLTEAKGNGTVITVKAKKKEDKRVKKDDNTDQHIALEAPKEEVFTYLMRTLPVLALITTFFWLYYVGTRAQQNSQASSGNKPTSSQKQEQDEEEEERDGRAVEAANE